MSATQSTGAGTPDTAAATPDTAAGTPDTAARGHRAGPDAQDYAGELGGFVLARSAVDRVSARRADTDWLAATWADPATRVLVLENARALVRFGDKEAELVLVPPAEAPEGLRFLLGVDDAEVAYFGVMGPPGCLESLTATETTADPSITGEAEDAAPAASAGGAGGGWAGARKRQERPRAGPRRRHPRRRRRRTRRRRARRRPGRRRPGRRRRARQAPGEAADAEASAEAAPEQQTVTEQVAWLARAKPGLRPADLREAAALLNDRDAGLFTHAVALANWHATHTHCPRCGTPTVTVAAGHAQRCPVDGSEHFPRIDPAVIMLVTDPDDRCLLARNRRWPERRVSILAGLRRARGIRGAGGRA